MITHKDERFFTQAYELAQYGEHRVRVGCVATIKSTPIAGGFNTVRNITTSGVHYSAHTNHAEMNVLDMIPYMSRAKVSLYVCRIDSEGLLKPSKPCRRCIKSIHIVGIKEVIFWDQTIQKIRPSSLISR